MVAQCVKDGILRDVYKVNCISDKIPTSRRVAFVTIDDFQYLKLIIT